MNNNRGNNNNRRRGRGNNNSSSGTGSGGNRPQGGGQPVNRIDSRARGNAPQMLEKFRKLASDAHLNGDRVQAEYYLQFADHYFRVIADTRVRQEEQRTRPQGERWQEAPEQDDDGLDFSNDGDFPTYDRAPPRREEPKDQQREQPREHQREQPLNQPREQQREPRRERPEYDQSRREPLNHAPAPAAAVPGPFEARQGDEGEPIDKAAAAANPFVPEPRGNRGLRPRGGNRFRRDEEAREGQAADVAAPEPVRAAPREGGLDPAMLPPAFGARPIERDVVDHDDRGGVHRDARAEPEVIRGGARAEPELAAEPAVEAAESAPAPRRRGRPRKHPLPVVDSATEVLNG